MIRKYKVWDKKEKKFVTEIDFSEFSLNPSGRLVRQSYGFDEGTIGGSIDDDRVEIVFFTGLKDESGKEIYEGDILEITTTYGGFVPITYEEGMFVARNDDVTDKHDFLRDFEPEVVGNIYENPELLKKWLKFK